MAIMANQEDATSNISTSVVKFIINDSTESGSCGNHESYRSYRISVPAGTMKYIDPTGYWVLTDL